MLIKRTVGLNHKVYRTDAPPDSLVKMQNADGWTEGALFQRCGLGMPSILWKGVVASGTQLDEAAGNLGVPARLMCPVDTNLFTTPVVEEAEIP